MMNPFQLQAWVFRKACLEDFSPDTVCSTLRREDFDTYKLANKQLEQMATQIKQEFAQVYGPLSRQYMINTNAELGLRGDVQQALHSLETTDPRDVRDAVRHIQTIQSRETWQGPAQPADLVDAIDYLEAAKVDVSGLRERLAALYPPVAHTDDEDDDQPVTAGETP